MKTIRHLGNRQSGTQVAELAVVLPLMLLLALIVAEGAGFIRMHEVLNNAAREGARIASLPENAPNPDNNPVPGIQQAVSTYACNNGVQLTGTGLPACAGGVAVSVTCTGATIGVAQNIYVPSGSSGFQASRVTVQCSYPLTYLPAVPWFGISNQIGLTGAAEFQEF
ncbi:MAG TPA: TadE/TadG family type IV pilus assembly protein [Terriglobales bacterium]|nr:TadE/TadG family type IV pilus assembly protein [Terriglobales bacterium]